jgi:hypothetical protein
LFMALYYDASVTRDLDIPNINAHLAWSVTMVRHCMETIIGPTPMMSSLMSRLSTSRVTFLFYMLKDVLSNFYLYIQHHCQRIDRTTQTVAV